MRRAGAPLRPPCAVPPAPRPPVGFSNVTARESSRASITEGSSTRHTRRSLVVAPRHRQIGPWSLAAGVWLVASMWWPRRVACQPTVETPGCTDTGDFIYLECMCAAPNTDEYGSVTAKYYDKTYEALRGASGDAEFYRALARECGGPVLELGCGTGRILGPIAHDGIACTGLDASAGMLAAFRRSDPPANVRLVQGRMQHFDLSPDRFQLIFAGFRAFQHLYTVDDQLACLAAVRRHLAPGG